MFRVTGDEVYFENIPFYGSNIVLKNSGGLGGEIYFQPDEIDFFGGNGNAISNNAGKAVYTLPATNIYRFEKSNLLEYLDCIKDEFKHNLLFTYKAYKQNAYHWKMIDEYGWNYRKEKIESAPDLTFNMYLKKSTNNRAFIGCNTSDIYSLVIVYTIIPTYTEMTIKRTDENGNKCFTFLLKFKNVDFASEINQKFEDEVERKREDNITDLLTDASNRGKKPSKSHINTTVYYRDPIIAAAVKERANGRCDLCSHPAPFNCSNGRPYLEEHHLVRLADGGDDSLENAVALCPNCHRKMHIVNDYADIEALKRRLLAYAEEVNNV